MTAAPAQLDLDVPDNDHFVPAVDQPDPEAEIADHLAQTGSVVPDCEQHPVPYPPPKIDKPRPHTCKTCERSFARLEHLKRHERSHTKEKPFECPVCERCFARRDLLLRHQQKLHQSTPSSSRPRHRRESSSGAIIGLGRVRKNSALSQNSTLAASAAASMRPRANTISHIDAAAIHFAAANAAVNGPPNTSGSAFESVSRPLPHGHNRHASLNGLPIHNLNFNQGYGGMAAAMGHRSMEHVLPILETHRIGLRDFNPGLRTAPPIQFNHDFDLDGFFLGPAPTINPTALCYSDSPPPLVLDPTSPYPQTMHEFANRAVDDAFDWLNGFESQMTFVNDDVSLESNTPNDNTVIDGSSPSERSSTSQSGISDIMLDGSKHSLPPGSTSMWHPAIGPPQMLNTYVIDPNSSVFPNLVNGISISPDPMSQKIPDSYFSAAPPSINPQSPSVNSTLNVHSLNPSPSFDTEPETPDSLIGGPFTPASTLAIQSNSNTLVSDIPCP